MVTVTASPGQNRWSQIAPSFCGIVVTGIGTAGLLGWLFDSSLLMSISPAFVSMKPNTAIGLILLGASACLLDYRHERAANRIAGLISLTVVALGFLTLAEYALTVDLGVDQFFFNDFSNNPDTFSPGRMAAITCFAFIIAGLALHLKAFGYRQLRRVPDILALCSGFIASFVLLGYLYDAATLRNLGMYGGMAIHTAAAFLLFSVAILLLRPESSILSPMLSGRPAGAVLRWILPSVVIGPVIAGLLRQLGEQAGLYSHAEGIALGVVITIFALVVLTLLAAHAVDRANRKVSEAESVVRRFFDLSNNLLCIAGMDGLFVTVNRAWERTLGFTADELTNRPFLEFVHPDDVEPTLHEYNRQAAGHDVISFENRYLCKDGSYRSLLWNATQPVDNGLIYASAHDITDRNLAERKIAELNKALSARAVALEAANAELEAFSYSVSHDLRAPLRSIDGFSQALLEDYADKLDGTGQDFLRRVRSSTQRMGQLIDDMLQLSRVTRSNFHRQSVDLSLMADSIVNALREKYPLRLVVVEIEDQLRAECDSRLTRIILENLFDNSWKYTSKKETAYISFSAKASASTPVYVISDDGVGFDAEYANKLFHPFQRLHGQEEFEGTGIGLATVKRIVTRHGGSVWAEGRLQQGASFYFTLAPIGEEGDENVRQEHSVSGGQPRRCRVDAPCA